jgi:glycosyltransferase involved in cell wall biosynthesis
MGPMRIVLTSMAPPDPRGDPGRAWVHTLVSGLVERGHKVSFWCIADDPSAAIAHQCLSPLPLTFEICPPVTKKRPLLKKLEHLRRPFIGTIPESLRRGVGRACRDGYDVLHFEYAGHGYLGFDLPRSLISVHGLARVDRRRGWQTPVAFASQTMGMYAEHLILNAFTNIRVLTDRVAGMVQRIRPAARTFTVPLALDPALYPVVGGRDTQPTVGFIGGLHSGQTARAAVRLITSIWPLVHARMPAARLLVAGRGAADVLAEYVGRPGVIVSDYVPNVTEFFAEASVFAFPSTVASGLHSKTMEAMAYGVPMVGTAEALEGVPATQGVHAFIEDDDAAFAERIVELLASRAMRERMAEAARALLVEEFSPSPVLDRVEAMYRQIASA